MPAHRLRRNLENEQYMVEHALLSELEKLVSEGRNPKTMDIDLLPPIDILRQMNDADREVPLAVEAVIAEIASTVDTIVSAFQKGGGLFIWVPVRAVDWVFSMPRSVPRPLACAKEWS